MTAATYDLACNRGTLLEEEVTYYTDDTYTVPVNLTGKHARLVIKRYEEELYTISDVGDSSTGEIVLGGTAGTILIRIWPVLTEQLGDALTYILVIDPGVDPIMGGRLQILPGV